MVKHYDELTKIVHFNQSISISVLMFEYLLQSLEVMGWTSDGIINVNCRAVLYYEETTFQCSLLFNSFPKQPSEVKWSVRTVYQLTLLLTKYQSSWVVISSQIRVMYTTTVNQIPIYMCTNWLLTIYTCPINEIHSCMSNVSVWNKFTLYNSHKFIIFLKNYVKLYRFKHILSEYIIYI